MQGWWVTDVWGRSPVLLGSWVIWIIVSIVLHELGHGYAAIKRGDDTPIETGHMTWNPMVHMGATSLIMFALFGFTWGAMPVDPSRFRGRYAEAYVAVAGPLVNLSLAALCFVTAALWITFARGAVAVHVYENMYLFLRTGAMLNTVLFLFNLVPVPPLDGSRILADFVPAFDRFIRTERGALVGLFAFALLFMFGGKKIWAIAFAFAEVATLTLVKLFGGIPP